MTIQDYESVNERMIRLRKMYPTCPECGARTWYKKMCGKDTIRQCVMCDYRAHMMTK